jgi:hypothetical protein
MLRPGQFTLKALFVATAFVALACGAIQIMLTSDWQIGKLMAADAVPILFCGAVGTLLGRVWAWLCFGAAIVCVWLLFVALYTRPVHLD